MHRDGGDLSLAACIESAVAAGWQFTGLKLECRGFGFRVWGLGFGV